MSLRGVDVRSPVACSGVMYAGVPSDMPISVMRLPPALDGEGDAEVGDQGVPILQQDVLGLDVAVDDARRWA